MYAIYNQEFYHHGILGQKWGVRRYQNKDGSLTPAGKTKYRIIKKGTRLNTVGAYRNIEEYSSPLKNPSLRSISKESFPTYTYNPNNKLDSAIYKGPFTIYKIRDKGAQVVKNYEMETIKDLKMPSRQQRLNEFKSLYNDPKHKDTVVSELEKYRQQLVKYHIGSTDDVKRKMKTFDCSKMKTKDDYEIGYEIFNHAMERANANKSTSEYMRRMSSKYDAMVDDNNKDIYNNANDPVIVFRTNEALKYIDSQNITIDEINRNYDYVKSELDKEGKLIKF